jgi:U3 small nucleolar RNA-associated protein 6
VTDGVGRALQRHPGEPALYVLAAAHELGAGAGGVEAARTLLQRGVRMNGERAELWAELVRVELSFVEGLRRRWHVLGVKVGGEAMDVDDEAREEVMQGAIVRSVMESAARGACAVGHAFVRMG